MNGELSLVVEGSTSVLATRVSACTDLNMAHVEASTTTSAVIGVYPSIHGYSPRVKRGTVLTLSGLEWLELEKWLVSGYVDHAVPRPEQGGLPWIPALGLLQLWYGYEASL